jgi:DEAD/DEAH box helicase domain-containing protein
LGTAIGERLSTAGSGIHELPEEMPTEFFSPNLYLYDAYPGGIGFSEPLYDVHDVLLQRTRELIAGCPCEQGCPSCIGPAGEGSERTKEAALAILERLCSHTTQLNR